MREIRPSGSEGGVADNGHPYPYTVMSSAGAHRETLPSRKPESAVREFKLHLALLAEHQVRREVLASLRHEAAQGLGAAV